MKAAWGCGDARLHNSLVVSLGRIPQRMTVAVQGRHLCKDSERLTHHSSDQASVLSIGMRYRFVLMTWPLGESTYQ